jgi:hypothetical protein
VAQRLREMQIDRVDLVDKGANGRRFALFKRDGTGDVAAEMEAGIADRQGFVAKIASAIGEAVAKTFGIEPTEPVEKAMTFAEIVAGREMTDALEEHWTTLQDSLWSAIYAYDDEGNALPLDAKKQLVAQNLDEFKTFLLERMDQGVSKQDGPVEPRLIEALVAKVGRKVSAARLARIKEAADALTAVLAEVEADEAKTEKRATAQEEDDMTPEALAAAIQKGIEPLAERITALEKNGTPEGESVEKADDGGADDEVTLGDVVTAIGKLADRVEAIEKRRGERQSATPDQAVKKSDRPWAGILD